MGKSKIRRSSLFHEGMTLLSRTEQEQVLSSLELFEIDPYHLSLRNHPLREYDARTRSLFVGGDLRIILRDTGDNQIFLIDVGDHARVYR